MDAETLKMFRTLKEAHPRWLFMSVVGSRNYGAATPESDTDIKVAVLPTFENYYRHKFEKVCNGGPAQDVDYTVHPTHEFMSHAFKGNMNFWEVFFADSFQMNPTFKIDADLFIERSRRAVSLNFRSNFDAMFGMAIQKDRASKKYRAIDPKKAWKEAQHAMRMLDTLSHYYETGQLILNLRRLEIEDLFYTWATWKGREDTNFEGYDTMFKERLHHVKELEPLFTQFATTNEEERLACMDQVRDALQERVKREVYFEYRQR